MKDSEASQEMDLDAVDLTLVPLLARGETVESAAKSAGVAERTVYRRLANPDLKAKIAEFRTLMFDSVAGQLLDSLPDAAYALLRLLKHPFPEIRYKTALKLIEFAFKTREISDRDSRTLRKDQEINESREMCQGVEAVPAGTAQALIEVREPRLPDSRGKPMMPPHLKTKAAEKRRFCF